MSIEFVKINKLSLHRKYFIERMTETPTKKSARLSALQQVGIKQDKIKKVFLATLSLLRWWPCGLL